MSQARRRDDNRPVLGRHRTDPANSFGREGRASGCTPREAVDDVLSELPADRMAILQLVNVRCTVFAHGLPRVQLKLDAKSFLSWTDAPLAFRDDPPRFTVVKGRVCRTGVD